MNNRERILCTLDFGKPDHVSVLGGFIVGSVHYRGILGMTEDEFWEDRPRHAIEAYRRLGVDGLILLRLGRGHESEGHYQYRNMTREAFEENKAKYSGPEDVRAFVEALPSPGEGLAEFDADGWKAEQIRHLEEMQNQMGDIVWMPTYWDIVHPSFEWYNGFGYNTYMEFMGLYPETAGKLFASQAEVQRKRAELLVEIYDELDMVPLVHIGTDICGKNGPVVSPEFLREHYFPQVKKTLEPLVEAGFRTVWHADGVIDPIVDDLLACGVSGFQGFQWEYGIDLEELVSKRTITGDKLTMFAGPSTSSTLPFGTIDDVHKEIEHIIDVAADKCALFVLPGNDVLPDTPLEHLVEMHRHAIEYSSRESS